MQHIPSAPEPEQHGLQGVSLLQADTVAGAPPRLPQAVPTRAKFVPREASVPSNSISRAFGFASLGASLLLGTARESVSRAFRGTNPDAAPTSTQQQGDVNVYSSFLSEANAERLARHLCRMRGAALKLGQMLSIQDDNLLPPQFQAALARVRAGADVMPQRQLEKVLVAELGAEWRGRVAVFDDAPMAAASIGQVHEATLHDGRRVVMKIQYPGVGKSIEADVGELREEERKMKGFALSKYRLRKLRP